MKFHVCRGAKLAALFLNVAQLPSWAVGPAAPSLGPAPAARTSTMTAAVPATFSEISEHEASELPTPGRIAEMIGVGDAGGWLALEEPLHAAAMQSYAAGRIAPASAWYQLARWANTLGQPQDIWTRDWLASLHQRGAGYPAIYNRNYRQPPLPMAACLDAPTLHWLLSTTSFSEDFFSLVQPLDFMPRVLGILKELNSSGHTRFVTYSQLALAIAVVYDVPPPEAWPHAQVAPAALARVLPEPLAAFNWWTKQDMEGRTYQRLGRLHARELKFVVDSPATFPELEWAQRNVPIPLARLPEAYSSIVYRDDRLEKQQMVWGEGRYSLEAIHGAGGICVDQAYYATEVGKARGVPTLLFGGDGNDGRHAWFGYLDGTQHWRLDGGRYENQKFVTGHAIDPQIWSQISDHMVKFLADGLFASVTYKQSEIHRLFALEYLNRKNNPLAVAAARKAVNLEHRNADAWDLLLMAVARDTNDLGAYEKTLREAAQAFRGYADLEMRYANRLSVVLRVKGDKSAADFEQRRIGEKNSVDRSDITIEQALRRLDVACQGTSLSEQQRVFNALVDTMGGTGGTYFFDRIVRVYVHYQLTQHHVLEALQAAEKAKRGMPVPAGSMLDQDFNKLFETIKNAS